MDNSIDLTNNIALSSVSNKLTSNNNADTVKKNGSDTLIHSEFESLITKALKITDIDQTAVAQARASVHNGTLDTPQNILRAAQNILIVGI